MERSLLFRIAIVVIALSAVVYLAGALGRLMDFMGDLLIILFFAWLVGSLLTSAVDGLMKIPFMPRFLAILIVYAFLIGGLAGFGLLVLPATVNQILEFTEDIPGYVEELPKFIGRVETTLALIGVDLDFERLYQIDSVTTIAQEVTVFITTHALRILQTVLSGMFAISSIVLLSFYIVLDGGRRFKEAAKVLPPAIEREARLIVGTIENTFHGYVRGMLIISTIYAVITAVTVTAVGLPAALPAALISGLLLSVPFVGDWLALIFPLTIAILSGDWMKVLIVASVLLFTNFVFLGLLTPRILGNSVRMPAMLVLVSVWVGVKVLGIWGALFGVPAGAVLYSLAVMYGRRIQERREAQERERKASAATVPASTAATAEPISPVTAPPPVNGDKPVSAAQETV